jgi:AAA+ ATPase superfamily predicted ATPase
MFIGRSEETARLRGAIEARAPKIALVYGRRRIGKTALIRQAIGRSPALIIEGLENQSTQAQIASFLDQASRQLRRKLPPVTSWQAALMELDKALAKRRMIIVLDEFQWLANYRQELVSTLKMVWETHLSRKPGRTLILCGSIASFMTTKVLNSSAFYGRVDLTIHLQGFRLAETARMLPKRGLQEVLDAQCFTGGVPKYLELLSSGNSIAQSMNDEAFRANGYFVAEYERIFTSHFGWNAEFQRLIRALAAAAVWPEPPRSRHQSERGRGRHAQPAPLRPGGRRIHLLAASLRQRARVTPAALSPQRSVDELLSRLHAHAAQTDPRRHPA